MVVSPNLFARRQTCTYFLGTFCVLVLEHMLVSRPQATPRIAPRLATSQKESNNEKRVIQLESGTNSLEVNTSLGSGEGVRHRRRTQFLGVVPRKVHHHGCVVVGRMRL